MSEPVVRGPMKAWGLRIGRVLLSLPIQVQGGAVIVVSPLAILRR
jgi:hypothetical protein